MGYLKELHKGKDLSKVARILLLARSEEAERFLPPLNIVVVGVVGA
jgi:hypothetical protein